MLIIGISGRAGSGKSTTAGLLAATINAAGYTVAIDAFAAGIKKEARRSGWNGIKDEAGRKLLQDIGEGKRIINPDHWIDALRKRWMYGSEDPQFLIISDCRHANEANFCRTSFLGKGVVWRITGRAAELSAEAAAHPSEQLNWELVDGDSELPNTGSLDDLVVFIEKMVELKKHVRTDYRDGTV